MRHQEFSLQTNKSKDASSGYLALFAQRWEPISQPRAIVCLIHGLGEHSGRYLHVAEHLTKAGFALLTMDLRGHGRSEGPRGHIPSMGSMLDDIGVLLSKAGSEYSELPIFLYGHSMGGSLALNYVIRRQPAIAGIIASAPALKLPSNLGKILVGQIMNWLYPAFTVTNGVKSEHLSRSQQVVEAYRDDPLVHNRISARLGMWLYESGQWAMENADQCRVPVLLTHGTGDQVCLSEGSELFASRVSDDCTLKLWEGLYHELHNEPESGDTLGYMVEWLAQRLAKQ